MLVNQVINLQFQIKTSLNMNKKEVMVQETMLNLIKQILFMEIQQIKKQFSQHVDSSIQHVSQKRVKFILGVMVKMELLVMEAGNKSILLRKLRDCKILLKLIAEVTTLCAWIKREIYIQWVQIDMDSQAQQVQLLIK